jgi:hypothetical protein
MPWFGGKQLVIQFADGVPNLDGRSCEGTRCAVSGELRFMARNATRPLKLSRLCPSFPKRVVLR